MKGERHRLSSLGHHLGVHRLLTFHILIFSSETPANQKQESPVVAMFVNGSGRNEQLHRGPTIDASCQVSVHLAKRFQRRLKKIGQSETKIACGGHVCQWIGTKLAVFIEDIHSCF
jgi:hypothetical protein